MRQARHFVMHLVKGVIYMSNTKFIFIDENIKKSFEEVIDDSEFQRRLDDFEHNKNIVYKTLEELKEMEQ